MKGLIHRQDKLSKVPCVSLFYTSHSKTIETFCQIGKQTTSSNNVGPVINVGNRYAFFFEC